MTRKGRHRNRSLSRAIRAQTRPLSFGRQYPYGGEEPEPVPELVLDVREALADGHPAILLSLAGALLSAVDPFDRDFDHWRGESPAPTRERLVRSLVGIGRPETWVLLAAITALDESEDEYLEPGQVHLGAVTRLAEWGGRERPEWLATMDGAEAYRTVVMAHRLGDCDTVVIGVRFPTGHELSAAVTVDRNLGPALSDAYLVPAPIGDLLSLLDSVTYDPDVRFDDVPLADARALLIGARARPTFRFELPRTATWPACRPVIEWMVRLLPDDGRRRLRRRFTEKERRRLVERFLASPFGFGLGDRHHRALLDVVLWMRAMQGPKEPTRWSPTAVEDVMERLPQEVFGDVGHLADAPRLLRALVRYCHVQRRMPVHLTDATVQAVDRCEAAYQTAIRVPHVQGPGGLLADVDALAPDGARAEQEEWLREERASRLDMLARAVGGAGALEALDDAPLPDEGFDWSGIPDDVHDRVAEALALCDACADRLLDGEARTAARRLLARIARDSPDAIRSRERSELIAGAVCWAVGQANELFSQRRGGLTQKALLAQFGLEGGMSDRAASLLRAAGFPRTWPTTLGSPDYLVSGRRRAILARYRSELESERSRSEAGW